MEEGRSWETSILVPIASTWSIACSNCKGAWKMWLTECLGRGQLVTTLQDAMEPATALPHTWSHQT
jgi:hypothetical protein